MATGQNVSSRITSEQVASNPIPFTSLLVTFSETFWKTFVV